jgi:hypothetical protein
VPFLVSMGFASWRLTIPGRSPSNGSPKGHTAADSSLPEQHPEAVSYHKETRLSRRKTYRERCSIGIDASDRN